MIDHSQHEPFQVSTPASSGSIQATGHELPLGHGVGWGIDGCDLQSCRASSDSLMPSLGIVDLARRRVARVVVVAVLHAKRFQEVR